MTAQRFTTDTDQLAAARADFPPEQIKKREQGGEELSYYEHTVVNDRLLDVFGSGYSMEVGRVWAGEKYVDVEVILTLTWVSGKTTRLVGIGRSDVLRGKLDAEKIVNEPLKSATSDGLKVAAMRLGVGAELYDKGYREDLKKQEEQKKEELRNSCQKCGGKIEPFGDYTTVQDVLKASRKAYTQRRCKNCFN